MSYSGFELADDALATDDSISLDLFETYGDVLHLDLEGLLDSFDLNDTFLFFVKDLNGMLELILNSLISLVANSQLFGDFLIVASKCSQFLFKFCL